MLIRSSQTVTASLQMVCEASKLSTDNGECFSWHCLCEKLMTRTAASIFKCPPHNAHSGLVSSAEWLAIHPLSSNRHLLPFPLLRGINRMRCTRQPSHKCVLKVYLHSKAEALASKLSNTFFFFQYYLITNYLYEIVFKSISFVRKSNSVSVYCSQGEAAKRSSSNL